MDELERLLRERLAQANREYDQAEEQFLWVNKEYDRLNSLRGEKERAYNVISKLIDVLYPEPDAECQECDGAGGLFDDSGFRRTLCPTCKGTGKAEPISEQERKIDEALREMER